MATQTTIPQLPQSELSVFVHKILLAHVGVFILTLALVGAGGYFGLRSYDKALAHAEALQAQFNTEHKALTDLLAQDTQARAQESAQQAALVEAIAKRNAAPLPVAVQTALQPDASAQDAAAGLTEAYTGLPSFGVVEPTSDGKVSSTVPQTQAEIQSREAEITLSANLKDEINLYTLEATKSGSLQNDLTSCESTVSTANATIAAYKKLAVRSKWKKFLGGAEKVGLVLLGVEIGHRL